MKKTNQKKTNFKSILALVLVGSTLISAAPKPVLAGSPQETIMDMATDMAKSIGGDKLKEMLFPNTIDYDRIRKDMEEVTRKVIVSAEADRILGRIGGASANARINLLDSDPVGELGKTRSTLVLDISELTKGQFQVPGIGNYVQGAQVEMSILAAMLENSPKPSYLTACDRGCVTKAIVDRAEAHIKHLNETTAMIIKEARDAASNRVEGCYMDFDIVDIGSSGRPIRVDIGWMFVDKARGYRSPYYGKGARSTCDQARDTYMNNYQQEARVATSNALKWMHVVRASWTKAQTLVDSSKYRTVTKQAVLDLAPIYFAANSSCYGQLKIAIDRYATDTSQLDACSVLKSFAGATVCKGSDADTLFDAIGCKAQ